MKYKNRGFTLLELLVLLSAIAVIAAMILPFAFKKKSVSTQPTWPTSLSSSSEIVVKERGWCDSKRYLVFEDKATKSRIFYFGEAMILLPNKEGQ